MFARGGPSPRSVAPLAETPSFRAAPRQKKSHHPLAADDGLGKSVSTLRLGHPQLFDRHRRDAGHRNDDGDK